MLHISFLLWRIYFSSVLEIIATHSKLWCRYTVIEFGFWRPLVSWDAERKIEQFGWTTECVVWRVHCAECAELKILLDTNGCPSKTLHAKLKITNIRNTHSNVLMAIFFYDRTMASFLWNFLRFVPSPGVFALRLACWTCFVVLQNITEDAETFFF